MALTDNLISVWHMNNAWTDSIGANHGTAYGATFSTSSKLGSHAGIFDGVDDRVDTGKTGFPTGSGAYTIAAWVYATQNKEQTIFGFGTYSTAAYIHMSLRVNGDIRYGIHTYDIDTTPSTAYLNNWRLIIMTHSGGTHKHYYDGVLVASFTRTVNIGTNLTPYIGAEGSLNANWFLKGRADELALWSRALTDGDIAVGQTATGEIAELWNGGAGIELSAQSIIPILMNQYRQRWR